MVEIAVPPTPKPLDIIAPQPTETMSFEMEQVQGLDAAFAAVDERVDDLEGVAAPKLHHFHNQGTPSDAWFIVHNLGFNPAAFLVKDGGGGLVVGADPEYHDLNSLTLHWPYEFGGTAELS